MAQRKLHRSRREEHTPAAPSTDRTSSGLFRKTPPCQTLSAQKCMCIFMPPSKLEREFTSHHQHPCLPLHACARARTHTHTHTPPICLKTKKGSFTHMATWKENEILSQGLWVFFFLPFPESMNARCSHKNVFISSGQPESVLFIIAQRSRGHNRFIRRLWSPFVSPILRSSTRQESKTALLATYLTSSGPICWVRLRAEVPSLPQAKACQSQRSCIRLSNCQKN